VLPGYRGISDLRQQFSAPLVILMAMVGAVLLIACANVANLLLARTTSRQREIALRLALGAGRGTILRQYLAESLVLALAGAVLGLVLATWTGALLLSALPGDPTSQTLSATPDLRVVAFALALSFVTAVIFGIAPALHATRATVTSALKEEAGSVAGGHRQARLRRVLVIAQIAASMLLLAGAGLFARSLYNLKTIDPGFDVDHLLAFSIDPTLNGYEGPRVLSYYERLQQELAAVPGVRGVSMSATGVLSGNQWGMTVRVDGYQAKEGEDMNPSVDAVGPGFFETMGIPLLAGRDFKDTDAVGAPRVAIINQTMARYYFGETNPVGRRFGFGRDQATDIEIVGVVQDVRSLELRNKAPRFVYVPYRQDPDTTGLTVYLRIAAGSGTSSAAIRQAAQRVDPNLPIVDMKSMALQVDESLFVERMVAALSIAFGSLAALLAALGLYGVMAYAVARRTREIGIRVALGAERSRVLWLVLRDVAMMAAAGVTLGLFAALYVTRRIESQLFGLSPTDATTLLAAVALLLGVAFLAGFIPARRATAIDPMVALRAD
jgi:predicted permease